MRTERLSFEGRLVFERVATGLLGIGLTVGVLHAPLGIVASVSWPVPLVLIAAAALLGASSLRGSDDTLTLPYRVFGLFAATMVGACFDSTVALAVTLGAFTGLAMAGPRSASTGRRVVGLVAGTTGMAWALWTVPELLKLFPRVPAGVQHVGAGAAAGVLFAAGLLLVHGRVHPDGLSARLRHLGGETGARLGRVWERCHQGLRAAPAPARREVLRLLEADAHAAERLAGALVTIDARLRAADRKDAETQGAQLRSDLAAASDAVTRERLASALASLSDSLEALDGMERQRERLGAELRLKLATLERAALALEAAQGQPTELKLLALRLSQPAATA